MTGPILHRPVIRPGRPSVRPTFQFLATVRSPNADEPDPFHPALDVITTWLQSKWPEPLSAKFREGETFATEQFGQRLEAIRIEETGLWTVRLTQPDAPFAAKAAVPGRNWTTDIAIRTAGDALTFGVRVLCASLAYATEPISLSRPRVVPDMIARMAVADCRVLSGDAWMLSDARDVALLLELIADPARNLPVVLVSQADRRRVPAQTEAYLVDPGAFAQKHVGLAHVVAIPSNLTFELTARIGRPWSAWGGAVRTYWPGIDFAEDVSSIHPMEPPERIVFWRQDDLEGAEAFRAFLGDSLFSFAATRRLDWDGLRFVTDARSEAAKVARSVAHDAEGERGEYERQIAALNDRIVELEGEAEQFNDDAIESDRTREVYRTENAHLRLQVESLRARLAAKLGHSPDEAIEIPADLGELPEWVDKHLAGRLVLHPRALQGLKNAIYEETALVFQSLLGLANDYRDMRLGVEGAKERWEGLSGRLGLRVGGSIAESRAGQEGDEYYVRFPPGTMQRRFLTSHLRKGSTKDDRYCLAIYFFWDDDTRQVVVGWLPSHLENRLT